MASEYGEDEWIKANIELAKKGFYVDLGCAWPGQNSNTEFLRKMGWEGIAVDGNPAYAKDWEGIGNFVCAVIGDGEPTKFLHHDAPDLSRYGEDGTTVETVPLKHLIAGIRQIDFISCDLEGYEYDALKTLDWSVHRPKIVISEYSTYGSGEDYRVKEMLESLGYRAVFQTVANFVFTL